MADTSPTSTRLITLLLKIRDGLHRSLDSLRQAPAGSELPDVQVDDDDVKAAALYLRDVGLQYDGLRLHGEFARLRNRCMDEWLASMTDGESQEYRDKLTELFRPFPSQGNPNDSVVADRRVAIVGWVAQLSEFVDELISSVTALSETQPDATDDNGQPPAPAPESQPPTDAARRQGGKGNRAPGESTGYSYHIGLRQAAVMVGRTKRTLAGWQAKDADFPLPVVEGGGGRASEWQWTDLRPYLERKSGRELPQYYPSDPNRPDFGDASFLEGPDGPAPGDENR